MALELSGRFVRDGEEYFDEIVEVEDVVRRSPKDVVPPERVAAVGWGMEADEETGTILLSKR